MTKYDTTDWKSIGATRKRAKAYVRTLKNDISKAKSLTEKNALRVRVNAINRNIERSYRGNKYAFNATKAAEMLEAQLPVKNGKRMTRIQRKNYIFRQQFRRAQQNNNTGLGKNGAAKVKIFYRATQQLWDKPSIRPDMRDYVILSKLGFSDFGEAVDYVLSKNGKALKAVSGLDIKAEITDENAGWYQGLGGEIDDGTSPDYMNYVESVLR